MDLEGYGERPGQSDVERLMEDSRTLSPAGVERAANGWRRHAEPDHAGYREAEKAALRAVEGTDQGQRWDSLRNELLGLTERGRPLVSWRAEHGARGHAAENALLGAALALVAGPRLDSRDRHTLVRPMAEALPWLAAPPAGRGTDRATGAAP